MSIATAYQSMLYWQYGRHRDGLTLPFLCHMADVSPRELVEHWKVSPEYMVRVNRCSTVQAYVTRLTPKNVEEDRLFDSERGSCWLRDGNLFWHKSDFLITIDEWVASAEELLTQGKPSRVRTGFGDSYRHEWSPIDESEKQAWLIDVSMYSLNPLDYDEPDEDD